MDEKPEQENGPGFFQATRWSVIVAAAKTDGANQLDHLGELCQLYWKPIYFYIRRRGVKPVDAEDLTQEFLSQFISGKILKVADPLKGKFRSFLLKCCKNFLINAEMKASAVKRGGRVQIISIQGTMEEDSEYQVPDDNTASPDQLFDRQWALTLLRRVLGRLEEENEKDGKGELFRSLKGALIGDALDESYQEIADRLGMTESNVKVSAHRLRKKFRDLVRQEIAGTVCTDREVDEELRFLVEALRG